MAQFGDATGASCAIQHRNDVELKAWLAKRPSEAALEPELPIIGFDVAGICEGARHCA